MRIRLSELEVTPNRILIEDRIAVELLAVLLRDIAASRLKRLRPDASLGTRKTNGAISWLITKRYTEPKAQAADEILLLIAVKDDRVQQAYSSLTAVEVEPHGERKPLALRRETTMDAFDLHYGAHRP